MACAARGRRGDPALGPVCAAVVAPAACRALRRACRDGDFEVAASAVVAAIRATAASATTRLLRTSRFRRIRLGVPDIQVAWAALEEDEDEVLGRSESRALFSLRECRFAGRVQLFGRCDPALLESFRKIGNDAELGIGLERFGKYRVERGDVNGGRKLLTEAQAIFARLGVKAGDALQRMLIELG